MIVYAFTYSLAVQQFTNYNRDAKLQQMPYVYISCFIEQNMLGNEPLYYKFGIWSLNSSLNLRLRQFQKFSKLMVLYERLQMLYEPKIRVTGSFRKL